MSSQQLTERGQRTYQRIVDTAADLVYADGAAATSLEDILASTGTSKSQLYHYFDGRQGLLLAIVDRQAQRIRDFHRSRLQGVHTLADLRDWAEQTVAVAGATGFGGCPLGALTSELPSDAGALRRALAQAFDGWQHELELAIVRLQEAGQARVDVDSAELALTLLAAVQGGLILASTRRSAASLRTPLTLVIEYLGAVELN